MEKAAKIAHHGHAPKAAAPAAVAVAPPSDQAAGEATQGTGGGEGGGGAKWFYSFHRRLSAPLASSSARGSKMLHVSHGSQLATPAPLLTEGVHASFISAGRA